VLCKALAAAAAAQPHQHQQQLGLRVHVACDPGGGAPSLQPSRLRALLQPGSSSSGSGGGGGVSGSADTQAAAAAAAAAQQQQQQSPAAAGLLLLVPLTLGVGMVSACICTHACGFQRSPCRGIACVARRVRMR
jgi:hypothetical protein